MDDRQDLVALGRTDATTPAVLGNNVFDPAVFLPDTVFRFSRAEYRFLQAYRLGVSLEEASTKAGLTPAQAERFLSKSQTVAWMQDRAAKEHIRLEWEEPGKWWQEGNEVWEGRKVPSKAQIEVWKAFGSRVAPEKHRTQEMPRIEININPASVKEAIRREQAREAEIVHETPRAS